MQLCNEQIKKWRYDESRWTPRGERKFTRKKATSPYVPSNFDVFAALFLYQPIM